MGSVSVDNSWLVRHREHIYIHTAAPGPVRVPRAPPPDPATERMRRPVVHVVAGESLDAEAPPIYLSIYIYPHAPLLVRFPVCVYLSGGWGAGGRFCRALCRGLLGSKSALGRGFFGLGPH